MAESEELKSLKYTVENEKGKAQSKIYELRKKKLSTDIRNRGTDE